jgi:asparagine synthase (glutamine-hydrolysing)
MCGIAGIFHYRDPDRPVDRKQLESMTRILAHRGPDGEGFYVEGGIGLGHCRLSIVDLSPTGAQPMRNADGSCWITYNGELYNHQRLRERLHAKGYRFRGTSDTETLVYLLEEYGPDCLAETAGIFGFAYWESKHKRLTLARDPLGVKQVYYHDNGSCIVFASEIKALFACTQVPRAMDAEGINQYIHFHTPLFDRTCFKDIGQLRAGEYLQITPNGFRSRRYWNVGDFSHREGEPNEDIRLLQEQALKVIGDQLMSDVAVGCFFSGGIDSSAIAAYAQRAGKRLRCFGVHFSNQGVIDERPFQEAAAKALGLELELTTVDGTNFPDDLMHLMYHQDEPVIGPAMIPMYYVSKLASSHVKVCLGGQGADEIFGGYARYALTHPLRMFFPGSGGSGGGGTGSRVGGNLLRQLMSQRVLKRLARNARNLLDWENCYFENFAVVPEEYWRSVLEGEEVFNRDQCRELFRQTTALSEAKDPADKVMHWDMQTYLTGLFHQDDRMSMSVSLESRVPMADPRMVQFAFHTPFNLKMRQGASKWILRKAVADVLPEFVLNRRKVGFDTPAESWMKKQHAGFVRELLLSDRARSRGIWNLRGIEDWLQHPDRQNWFNLIWKVICLESWAQRFLDTNVSTTRTTELAVRVESRQKEKDDTSSKLEGGNGICDYIQLLKEDGLARSAKRAVWEVENRSGLKRVMEHVARSAPARDSANEVSNPPRTTGGLFASADTVVAAMAGRIPEAAMYRLRRMASDATCGRIFSFGWSSINYGNPPDWHRNPANGCRWPANRHWSEVLHAESTVGDVKFTWEAARFPHAYFLGRSGAFHPEAAEMYAEAFNAQIASFLEQNPVGRGVHWNSGQEIALRTVAWQFGLQALGPHMCLSRRMQEAVSRSIYQFTIHLEKTIYYAENFVFNNHLLSEGLGLYLAALSLPASEEQRRLANRGRAILEEQADRQFYSDGGYICQSHNYQRGSLQLLLVATALARAIGETPCRSWLAAMERSLDFLVAHQNPSDGRLPNYGFNDGSLPCVLSCCDFSDFRPTLQALSIASRGERIFESGPWDEEACWFLGGDALDTPLREPTRISVSFPHSGFHVLRGKRNDSAAGFRCGDILDRFSQMDMLHLDVWWRGHNVLVDAGSYLYNGPEKWHSHFLRTESHNTVQVDGLDQMVHYNKFKCLYWTKAKLLRFEDNGEWAICDGEHYSYERHPGRCVHRRSVLFVKDDIWVVVDRLDGSGTHRIRLQWLGGEFPYTVGPNREASLQLRTPDGPFFVSVFDDEGRRVRGDVAAGQDDPPRGWLSRSYGKKTRVPSLAVELSGQLPFALVSILGPHVPSVSVSASSWSVTAGDRVVDFEMTEFGIQPVSPEPSPAIVL